MSYIEKSLTSRCNSCLKISTRERFLTVSEKRSLFGISIFLFHRLDSAIRSTATIMAVQSQSYDFPVPQFPREFFEYYIIPMGWESGNRDRRRNAGLFAEKSNFWT